MLQQQQQQQQQQQHPAPPPALQLPPPRQQALPMLGPPSVEGAPDDKSLDLSTGRRTRTKRRRPRSDSDRSQSSGSSIPNRHRRRGSKRSRRRSRSRTGVEPLNGNYRFFGHSAGHGIRNCLPVAMRQELVSVCDEELTAIRTARLTDAQFDELLFVKTDILPTMRVAATKASSFANLKDMVQKEAQRLARTNPARQQMLSPDFANLREVAMRLGYPDHLVVPVTSQASGCDPKAPSCAQGGFPGRTMPELTMPTQPPVMVQQSLGYMPAWAASSHAAARNGGPDAATGTTVQQQAAAQQGAANDEGTVEQVGAVEVIDDPLEKEVEALVGEQKDEDEAAAAKKAKDPCSSAAQESVT